MAKHERDAKRAFWRGVLQRYSVSGLVVRAFCQREQLTESAFFAWRRTIGQRDAEGKRTKTGLLIGARGWQSAQRRRHRD